MVCAASSCFLAGGVGVGPQGKACVVVAQHGGDGFDVHAVLESQGGEGVAEIVEPEMLQTGVFQDPLVKGGHRVRMVHTSCAGGGEEPGVIRVLGVLLDEQLHRLLGDSDLPDGVLRLGTGDHKITRFIFHSLFADGDGPLLHVQVRPLQGHQLTLSDAADQLRAEHGQGVPPLRCVQVCLQIIGLQCLHLLVLCLGHHAAVCGDSDQQLLLWGLIRGPEDRDRGVDDRFILFFPTKPLVVLQISVGYGMMLLEVMHVNPATFGPFLKESRLQSGMTQE